MSSAQMVIALDVGEKRIGAAQADTQMRIPVPFDTIDVDGREIVEILQLIEQADAGTVVVGYPRNQAGEATAQSVYVEAFAARLQAANADIRLVFQDESLTSVLAEERLKQTKKPYTKADIDAQAAAIILTDYLEEQR